MYARATFVQAPAGKVTEGLRLWYENVLPITKNRPGFKGVLSLVDKESGKALSITLWDMEANLMATIEADYHKQAVARYGEYFSGVKAPENYEVDYFEVRP